MLARWSRLLAAPAFAVSAMAIASPAAAQQTGDVEGTVLSRAGGSPLSDVSVFVPGLRRGAVTDGAGRFRITGLPEGEQKVVAHRVGFAEDTVSVTIAANAVVQAEFRLREAAAIVPPIVVSATQELQRRSEGSVTIDALGGAEIRETRAAHPSGIMNRIAGVHVSELSGEGHSMAMRQPITTKPMYLYLEDGVPTRATGFFNHNALYEVNIPQSGGLEIVKGPGTALYGSDAIGGVINVLTRPAPLTPELDVGVEGGAYGYRRVLASGGLTKGHNGVRADLNITHSDNWKQLAPFDRASGTIRWDAVLGASGWSARTVLTGSKIDQQDVPAISRAIFDTAYTVNLAPIAYRRVRALRLSSAIEKQSGSNLWSFTPYGRINDMGLLPSWQLTFDPQTWETDNNSAGFLARWRRDFAPMHARMILGTDGDWSPGRFVAKQALTVRTGTYRAWSSTTDGATQYDYDVTYHGLSPYAHFEASPVSRLHIDLGLRADFSGYDYATHVAPVDTGAHRVPPSTSVSYAHVSPKVGASLELSPAANIFASYRSGFRAPSQSQLFQQNSATNTVDLRPVRADSYETGVRGQLGSRFVYQVSAYDMTIRDDIITFVTAQNTREATNAGKTRHRGVEASAGAALTSALRLDASYSTTSQRYVEWTPQAPRTGVAGVSYSGNLIEQAPRDLGNVLLTFSPRALRDGRLALEWSHTGRYAADPANVFFYSGYDILSLHFNTFVAHRAELFTKVTNLTNRRYAELVSYDQFQRDQYTPGAPRTVYGGLRYAW
jgi:outer membrane receptor protein involved in Fe transport